MKKYEIEVIETLSRVVEQEGSSYEDAEDIVRDRYRNEDIVLDWEDCEGVIYKQYPYKELQDNFSFNIEFNKDENKVYISRECSSGANYRCDNIEDLKNAINEYIDNYINDEIENVNENINREMEK